MLYSSAFRLEAISLRFPCCPKYTSYPSSSASGSSDCSHLETASNGVISASSVGSNNFGVCGGEFFSMLVLLLSSLL